MLGGDGQEVLDFLIRRLQKFRAFTRRELDFVSFFRLEQVFRFFAPRAVVILVQNHAILIAGMHPFVLGFDAAGTAVAAQIVLKRAETDKRSALVGFFEGETAGFDELPACKIYMAFQVGFSEVLHSGLEGQHKHFLPSHL